MNMGYNNVAPVSEGEELDVKIIAVGDKGDGIAKKDGFVLVVPGTQVDDEVRIKITKVLRKVGFAEVVNNSDAAPTEKVEGETEESTEEISEETTDVKEENQEETKEEEKKPKEASEEEQPKDSEDF